MPDLVPGAAEQSVAPVTTPTPDAPTANSSTAETEGATPTMLESVKAALSPDRQGESPAPQTQEKKAEPDAKAEGEPDPDPDELTDEEAQHLKEETRRRIDQLLNQRKSLREEVKTLQTKAETADRLNNFMQQTGVTGDDFNKACEIMAAMKTGNPHKAWELLSPIVAQFQQVLGTVLPNDLQEQVRLGYITEPHAQEIARLRSQNHYSTVREQQAAERAEQEARQREVQSLVAVASDTANKWEQAKRTSDPDWHLKADRVHELVELHVVRNGCPRSAEDVTKMLNDIHVKVTKEIKRFQPAAHEVKPTTGESSTRSVAEPTSVLEAIKQRLTA